MNAAFVLGALVLGQAAAPSQLSPLIVGVVRDRLGDPIAGAHVHTANAATTTQSDGTFALAGNAGQMVTISCAYCVRVTVVAGDAPIVAIVRRYDGVAANGPTARDIARLPFADPQTAIALQPYQIVNESSRVLPGTRVLDRGQGYHGAPMSFDNVPVYDIAADISPLAAAPPYATRDIVIAPNTSSPQYGDEALAGYVDIRTSASQPSGRIVGGNDGGASLSLPNASFAAFGNALENRNYAEAGGSHTLGPGVLRWNAMGVENSLAPSIGDYAGTQTLGAHVQYDDGERPLFASASLVRGSYDAVYDGVPVASQWSDTDVHVGSHSSGSSYGSHFLDAGVRFSSGGYSAYQNAAATVTTADLAAGVTRVYDRFDVEASAAGYDVRESAIAGDIYPPKRFVLPSLRVAFHPDAHWRVEAASVSGFGVASMLERLGIAEDAVPVERESHQQFDVSYGDGSRFSVSATAIRGSYDGIRTGTLAGDGAAFAWQISPEFSLRAWSYRITPSVVSDTRSFALDAPVLRATTASAWLTYENDTQTRVDLMYRRSLMDWMPYEHLDAFVSGRLTRAVRWFVKSEDRHRARYASAGLEFVR